MCIKSLLTALTREAGKPDIRSRESGPGQRETGIQLHRALIGDQSFAGAFIGMTIFVKATLEIRLMRLDILRSTFRRRLYFRLDFLFLRRTVSHSSEAAPQLFDDCLSELG